MTSLKILIDYNQFNTTSLLEQKSFIIYGLTNTPMESAHAQELYQLETAARVLHLGDPMPNLSHVRLDIRTIPH